MENTNKHEMNVYSFILILIIIAYASIQIFVYVAEKSGEDVQCYWWGCKFTSNKTFFYTDSNMTYKEAINFLNETINGTKCFVNNTWYNVSCKEILKPKILKELEEVLNKTKK